MTYDTTTLANMTIGHLGIGASIGDLDTENSAEAIQCRRYFVHCRDFMYRLRRWPFAARRTLLTDLGVTGTNYQDVWGFRYNYPNFCMRVNHIVNPAQRAPTTAADKIPFEIASKEDEGSDGKVILCDQESAVADYNYLIEDVGLWDAEFAENFTLYLALRASRSLRVKRSIIEEVRNEWTLFLKENMMIVDSEGQPDPERISQFQAVRG